MAARADFARPVFAEQIGQRIRAVGEGDDVVVDAGAADVALDQARMARVVLDHHDTYWLHDELLNFYPVPKRPA